MELTYQADDGYAGGSRPLHTDIGDDEIRDCATDEEAMQLIEDVIYEDFQQKVSPGYDYDKILEQVKQLRASD